MIATPAIGNWEDDQLNENIASRVPLGRLGKQADIAESHAVSGVRPGDLYYLAGAGGRRRTHVAGSLKPGD